MERLQGPINHSKFSGDHLSVEESSGFDLSYLSLLDEDNLSPSLDQKMPFLQMLQGLYYPPLAQPNLELLLSLQRQKNPSWSKNTDMDPLIPPLELESCITHASESLSPVKSETKKQQYPLSSSYPEVVSSAGSQDKGKYHSSKCSSATVRAQKTCNPLQKQLPAIREKRKRKRTRPSRNSEEVENKRMTHIAVERNRRKQMNDHLSALRSLMPTSFVQRGDQASIIGGAIDFIKELEQLLQSLQAQKQGHGREEDQGQNQSPFIEFFTSPQYTCYSSEEYDFKCEISGYINGDANQLRAENRSLVANIEVSVIQTHVVLKLLSPRRSGQLLKIIAALEDLNFAILHLNVTSSETSVLYSFNLKIEDGCKLGSADEIATAVYHILSFVNSN